MKFRFSRKNLAIPFFLFLILFVLLPICIIVFYAFTDEMGNFTLKAFEDFFTSTVKLNVLLISLLIGLYSGRTPQEILSSYFSVVEKIGLRENLSPTRANGLVSMIAKIKEIAGANV